jgi:hypothetical protein
MIRSNFPAGMILEKANGNNRREMANKHKIAAKKQGRDIQIANLV